MRVPLNELTFALSRALDFVEQELLGVTTNHGKRTAYASMRLCRAMGLPESEVFDMASCAILHDNALTAYMLEAGPGNIGRLEHFEMHCEKGEENAQAFPFLEDSSGIILYHHENWDGSGFHKLAGKDISTRAAILRLVDNMDLHLRMGDGRPDMEKEIIRHAQKYNNHLYSPDTVDALIGMLNEDFVRDMKDDRIDEVLTTTIPNTPVNLTTEQLLEICNIFAVIIDAKSPFTRNHSRGIGDKARRMGQIYGFDPEHLNKLTIAASLHDIGKLATPLSILEKPAALTNEEFDIMRGHAAITWEMLQSVHGLEEITEWAGNHHEKLDGTGYPHGYTANQLAFEGRLLACCDIYQALTEDRPYRVGMDHKQAQRILNGMVNEHKLDGRIVADMDSAFR